MQRGSRRYLIRIGVVRTSNVSRHSHWRPKPAASGTQYRCEVQRERTHLLALRRLWTLDLGLWTHACEDDETCKTECDHNREQHAEPFDETGVTRMGDAQRLEGGRESVPQVNSQDEHADQVNERGHIVVQDADRLGERLLSQRAGQPDFPRELP